MSAGCCCRGRARLRWWCQRSSSCDLICDVLVSTCLQLSWQQQQGQHTRCALLRCHCVFDSNTHVVTHTGGWYLWHCWWLLSLAYACGRTAVMQAKTFLMLACVNVCLHMYICMLLVLQGLHTAWSCRAADQHEPALSPSRQAVLGGLCPHKVGGELPRPPSFGGAYVALLAIKSLHQCRGRASCHRHLECSHSCTYSLATIRQ